MTRARKPASSQTVRRGKGAKSPARRSQRGPGLTQRALAAQPPVARHHPPHRRRYLCAAHRHHNLGRRVSHRRYCLCP